MMEGRLQLLLILAALAAPSHVFVSAGDMATLSVPLFTSLNNNTHRQNICHRYDLFRAGEVELRDALSGLALQPLMARGDFMKYDDVTGIDEEEPGILVDLMDALAERGNFTWRQSFAVMEEPEVLNQTWTNMLFWGIENYDVAVNSWDQSLERMEKGAAYVEPFFDGTVILIDQEDPPIDVNEIIWFNWLSPFENAVWFLIVFTILLSAVTFQVIEFLSDDREERSMTQWFSDNVYLSCLNFTQNFEYAPNSVAGRVFGVSMGMWALVMTATYTANLASLFVQEQRPALVVDSIEQAIALEIPICTWGLTNSDLLIKERFPDANRVPLLTEWDGYYALRQGECGLVAAYKQNWLNFEGNSKYNPDCDLKWVGRVVAPIKSGFAVKADAGHMCSSLIRDVLNLLMTELIVDGVVEMAWDKHRAKTKDLDCHAAQEEDTEEGEIRQRKRRLQAPKQTTNNRNRRRLKAVGTSVASSNENASLTIQQMMGTFAFHWSAMVVSVIIGFATNYYQQYRRKHPKQKGDTVTVTQKVVNRTHGPIIGWPPQVNTMITRNVSFRQLGNMPGSLSTPNLFPPGRRTVVEEDSEEDKFINENDDMLVRASHQGWPRLSSHRHQSQEQYRPKDHNNHSSTHEDLKKKQDELSLQMNAMMGILETMKEQQQQMLLQLPGQEHQQHVDT